MNVCSDDTWYAPQHPPYGGGPGGFYPPPEIGLAEHRLHMRGVPFDVTNAEIYEVVHRLSVAFLPSMLLIALERSS